MKIVTLCTCGLGTCFILKIKVEEVLAGMGLPCEVVPCNLGDGYMEEGDLYVVPYGMDVNPLLVQDAPVVVVQDVLDVQELSQKLLDFLETKRGKNGC